MLTLRSGAAVVRIDPGRGGRVAQFIVDGLDLLVGPGDSVTSWGAFVMAPWAGRVRRGRFAYAGVAYELPTDVGPPHAIHGTVLDRPWTVVEAADASAVLECTLGDRWPWPGRVRHTMSVGNDRVEFRLDVHAEDQPFPAAAGWHPWFLRRLDRGGPVRTEFEAAAMLARDEDGIPSGVRVPVPARPWDDCFDRVQWPVTLSWPGAVRLEVRADTRYAVVFDQLDHAVCVEPQTGPPDALTLEPTVVTTGRPLTATMTWTWDVQATRMAAP